MTPHRAGHAAVIGGGMAGILAARALADHFAEVTVVERDQLPDQPDFRNGVPQARHLHTFWAGGLRAVEQLLPGIEADLIAAGACPVRFPTDMRWLTPADRWMGRFPATQRLASASRILIEWVVRRRVEQTPGIRFVAGHEVRSLRLDRHGDVSGLTMRARRGDGSPVELPADLVVDASGRGSLLPDWLEALGRRRPPGEHRGRLPRLRLPHLRRPGRLPRRLEGHLHPGRAATGIPRRDHDADRGQPLDRHPARRRPGLPADRRLRASWTSPGACAAARCTT